METLPTPETHRGASETTRRSHLEHAFAKLGVHTRTEAIARLAALHVSR